MSRLGCGVALLSVGWAWSVCWLFTKPAPRFRGRKLHAAAVVCLSTVPLSWAIRTLAVWMLQEPAAWSHNQGRAGDSLWPYTLYRYDAASDRYVQTALVDAWSRAYTEPLGLTEPFPEDIDRSGTGVVYYIYTEDGSAPARTVDAADYAAWRAEELGAGAERALPWQSLTEENIRGLTETP